MNCSSSHFRNRKWHYNVLSFSKQLITLGFGFKLFEWAVVLVANEKLSVTKFMVELPFSGKLRLPMISNGNERNNRKNVLLLKQEKLMNCDFVERDVLKYVKIDLITGITQTVVCNSSVLQRRNIKVFLYLCFFFFRAIVTVVCL